MKSRIAPPLAALPLFLLALTTALRPDAAKASITVTQSSISGIVNGNWNTFFGTSIPTMATLETQPPGSTTDIDWSTNGPATILSFDMMHHAEWYPYAQTYGHVNFTANADSSYKLSGFYNVSDPLEGSRDVSLHVYLRDITQSTDLFDNSQYSINTRNEQFELGGLGGDSVWDYLTGSLTGNLIAGHDYQLFLSSYIYTGNRTAVTALGNVTLTIGSPEDAGVPEPFSLAIWGGVALCGCLGVARCRAGSAGRTSV